MSRKMKNILMCSMIAILICTDCFTINLVKSSNITKPKNNMEMPSEMLNNDNLNMNKPPEKPNGEDNISDSNQLPEMPNDLNNMEMSNVQDTHISVVYYILFGTQSFIISLLLIYLIMSKFNKKTLKKTLSSNDKILIFCLSITILTILLTYAYVYITNNFQASLPNSMDNIEGNNTEISYSGAYEIMDDTEIVKGEYSSIKEDENAILISGDINVTIENINVNKNGDSNSGDNTSFYGINSAILAKSGATLNLKNINVTTDAIGANGVFSYGGFATTNNNSSDNTTINISDSTIITKKDNSGGIMTTGGGITNAYNLTINTSGISSAAIRTDRGGGTVSVDGGTYTTEGSGSPTIYSTAKIIVKNASLISKISEGIIVEGKNSVEIENCDLIDSNTKLNGLSTTYKNIFLYQSMSGDADTGNSSFTATNSKITTNNGDTFYVTNTSSTINLINNIIVNNDKNGNFLRIQADSWGNNGSNGGRVNLILINQIINGNIVVDNISTLDMNLNSNSYYEGTINSLNSAKLLNLKLDETSTIKLTGDSYINSLDNGDNSNSNIDFNGYTLYVNGVAIN